MNIPMRKSRLMWMFAGALLLFNIVMYSTRWGGENVLTIVSDSLPVVCSLVSTLCLFIAFRRFKEFDYVKIAWMLILTGIFLDFIAESIYGYLEVIQKVDMNVVYPTIADFFWCGAYIPMFIGLAMMFFGFKRSGLPMGNSKLYGLLAIICFILAITIIYFVLIPIINDNETSPLEKIIYLFYPVSDTLTVIPALILMYITSLFGKGALSKPWKLLAIGFICFTIADLLFSYLDWKGLYGSGNFIDLAWHLGYLLIGLAGIYQSELIESFTKNNV
jgi:hypothetical protein